MENRMQLPNRDECFMDGNVLHFGPGRVLDLETPFTDRHSPAGTATFINELYESCFLPRVHDWVTSDEDEWQDLLEEEREKVVDEDTIYEQQLVECFTALHAHEWKTDVLELMFQLADLDRLRQFSQPLPGSGPFTVYRGVSGPNRLRKVRGLSWTADLGVACSFATRYMMERPAVYTADVKAEEVYLYLNDREEDEFIVRPRSCRQMPLLEKEMRRRAI